MPHHRQPVTAVRAPAAIGPYSHAVSAAGLLFCSGQIPLDPDSGELVGDTPAEQAVRCLENLKAVCAAAGATLGDATVLLKAESLQRTGSFKIRGALNKLAAVGEACANGVVAGSAGNHAQAL